MTPENKCMVIHWRTSETLGLKAAVTEVESIKGLVHPPKK